MRAKGSASMSKFATQRDSIKLRDNYTKLKEASFCQKLSSNFQQMTAYDGIDKRHVFIIA